MQSLRVSGSEALGKLDEIRASWKPGAPYPFLVGTEEEWSAFNESLVLPADRGDSIVQSASAVDIPKWLGDRITGKSAWPKKGVPKQTTLVSLYDLTSNERKSEVYIGLIELNAPHELFARLSFGGWNQCPEPHIHVALHKYWSERFSSTPVAISSDIIECLVMAPPKDKRAALDLAQQHNAYCGDIVEQGVGTVGKLGSSLLDGNFWYFWWD